MSGIADLAMLVNDNFSKTLNSQLRELSYSGSYLITASKTFTPDASGWHKIIVISRGGNAYHYERGGSSGAVAIKTLHLDKNSQYNITIDNSSNPEKYSSFNDIVCYNAKDSGPSSYGIAGVATGGDFNYAGLLANSGQGQDVGVFIPQLMKPTILVGIDSDGKLHNIVSGEGILGFGGGQTQYGTLNSTKTKNKGGCVLIIPLEIE